MVLGAMNKFSKFTAPLRAAWAKLDAWTFGHAKHVAMAAGVAFVAYCVKRLFGLTMFGAGDDAAIEALKIPDIIPDLPVDSPDEDEFASGLFVDEEES